MDEACRTFIEFHCRGGSYPGFRKLDRSQNSMF